MSWGRKSPFASSEEAARRMVELVAKEAASAGTPLTDLEMEIMVQGSFGQTQCPMNCGEGRRI